MCLVTKSLVGYCVNHHLLTHASAHHNVTLCKHLFVDELMRLVAET